MPETTFILLLVESPEASARWYSKLLDRTPVEESPTFAMFPLKDGLMLGLWSRHTVEPAATGTPGASEIGFTVASPEAVHATHAEWLAKDVVMAQPPTALDFGLTFVGLDPDGHRLRVFAPAEATA